MTPEQRAERALPCVGVDGWKGKCGTLESDPNDPGAHYADVGCNARWRRLFITEIREAVQADRERVLRLLDDWQPLRRELRAAIADGRETL